MDPYVLSVSLIFHIYQSEMDAYALPVCFSCLISIQVRMIDII
jgi:hypothetical protein